MPKKPKKDSTDPNKSAEDEKPKRVIVRAKDRSQWAGLIAAAEASAWRRLRFHVQVRDKLLAGKPANLDAANAMLKARGLEDHIEAVADIVDPDLRAKAAERIKTDEGLCEFSRRPGKAGIWMPSNNVKAMFKENWSVLGLRVEVRGSRGAMAEGLFVFGVPPPHVDANDPQEKDWIYLGEQPTDVYTAVSHTVGPSGPVSSIKRHEYVERVKLQWDVVIATAKSVNEKISDDELAKTLVHAAEHGLGACRAQGFGRFDILSVEELGAAEDPTEAAA